MAAQPPSVERVLEDRRDRVRAVPRPELVGALESVPPEVRARALARGHEVDLLPCVLADVGDPHVACLAVPREPPRVAQAVRPDLGQPAPVRERVAGRDRVLPPTRGRRVDAQDLAEQRVERLAVAAGGVAAAGVAGAAAVPEPEVQEAVGPEAQLAAVVVGLRLFDSQDLAARPRSTVSPPIAYSSTRVSPFVFV